MILQGEMRVSCLLADVCIIKSSALEVGQPVSAKKCKIQRKFIM